MRLLLNKSYSSFVHNVRKSVFLITLLSFLASGFGSAVIAQNGVQKENAINVDLLSSSGLKNEDVINGIDKAQNPRISEIDGSRDASFNIGTGANSFIQALAIQDDDKILLGGVFTSFNGTAANRIIRLNADGSVDNSFVYGSGFDESDVYVSAIFVQSDGKILIAGSFTRYNGTNANRIVRLNANGSVDTSFNYGTGFDQLTTILKQQEDGKIIVGGRFTTYKGVTANHMIRLNLDGNLDNTFSTGSGFSDFIYDIAIQPDGKFIVGGAFVSYAGTTTANRIIRLQSNGSVDNTFTIGSGFDSVVITLALQDDGRIVVGGAFANFTNRGANRVVRLKENGEFDFSFGSGLNNTLSKVVIQHDGKIILIGRFTSFNGTAANRIIRLNMDGSVDTSFEYGTGFNDTAELLEIQSDGKLVITGRFSTYNGTAANKLIRLDVELVPTTAAPTPTYLAENVISVFSDTYTTVAETNLNPFWSQTTEVTFMDISGNNTMKYSNFNYQGIQLDETNYVDVSGMDYLHLDYWTSNSTELKVYLISPGPIEVPYSLTVPTSGWNSIDIPLSEFDPVVLADVFQFKFEGNGTIYIDNLLFFKEDQVSSTAGIDWEIQSSAADNQWTDITYGNGLFVAIASSGTSNRVMTSPDGKNWTARNTPIDNNWYGLTYGNGLFVAVASSGSGNRVMTSPDGNNWTTRNTPVDNDWRSVIYGKGLFVAVSASGSGNQVMTSPDGINWTIRSSAINRLWFDVAYGNDLFVAVAFLGTGNRVMTSPDGINWTARESAADNNWNSVTYGNGLFVAVASTGSSNRVMTSPDGVNWTARESAADNNWNSVTFGNGLFVAVASTGSSNRVMTSPDGINWTARTSAVDNNWNGVAYANGMFVAVAYSGTGNRVMTSGTFTPEATDTPTITFQADMRSLLKNGIFDPSSEKMTVVGNFDGSESTDWSTHYELTEGETVDSIWTTSVQIINPNPSFSYKYKILSENVTNYYNSGWDSPAFWLGDNRIQDIPESNLVLDPIFPAIHLINAEPNNRIDNAFYLPLTETRTFDISGLDDPDFYSITVNEGDIVEILISPEEGTNLDLDLHVIELGNLNRIAYSDYSDGLGSEKVVLTVPETADENAEGSKTINFRVAHYVNQTYIAKTNADLKPRVSAESGNYSLFTTALAPQFDGPNELSSEVESDTVVSISWSEVSGASNYRLSVSRGRDFFQFYASGSITDVEYNGTSAVLNLPTDSVWYYYRVRAFNNAGETSRFSAVDSFYTLNQVQIDLNSDLVAHYTFEGNAVDLTGNNLNGTIIGTVDFPAGRLANTQTAHFDEQGEYISIPDNELVRIERDLTISTWINNQNAEINSVLTKTFNTNEGPYTSYGINAHGSATGSDPRFVFSVNTDALGEQFLNDTDPYNFNEWYHVVGTYNGSVMRLYVNGVFKSEVAISGNLSYNAAEIVIGDNPSSATTYQGHVDDVRLYSRALTQTEISELYALESKESISVWPGDTNQDNIVSSADLIPIARYYGDVGVAFNEGLAWQETQRLAWDLDENNPARVFADTDGNGIIESADILALYANYSKMIGAPDALKKQESVSNPIELVFLATSLSENETQVEISIAQSNQIPIKGLSFKLAHNAFSNDFEAISNLNLIQGFSKSLSFFRINNQKSELDFAIGSTQSNSLPEKGFIASFVLPIPVVQLENGSLTFKTKRLIDKNGTSIPINPVWKTLVTSVENETEIPTQNFVDQNYPNPFNPSTKIRFGLNETAKVNLEVFDIQGRKVKTILSEIKSAGTYNERVKMEKGFASGLYFYRLRIEGVSGFQQIFTRKMLLVK